MTLQAMRKVWHSGGLQWHNGHIKFRENRFYVKMEDAQIHTEMHTHTEITLI